MNALFFLLSILLGICEVLRALMLYAIWAAARFFELRWEELIAPFGTLSQRSAASPGASPALLPSDENPPALSQVLLPPLRISPVPSQPLLRRAETPRVSSQSVLPPIEKPRVPSQLFVPRARIPRKLSKSLVPRAQSPPVPSPALSEAAVINPGGISEDLFAKLSQPLPRRAVATARAMAAKFRPLELSHGEVLVNGQRLKIAELVTEYTPRFEGNENEANWKPRQDAITTLRDVTKSIPSAPKHMTAYVTVIKGLHGAITRAVLSLRTTLSTHGMCLVREAIELCGSDLDSIVEFIIIPLIKQCGNTKHQTASEADTTVIAVFTHTTYTPRILQHILNTMDERSIRLRGVAIGWLDAVLIKYKDSKHMLEEKGGADIIYKLVNKGLTDADSTVRMASEPVYWNFSSVWPTRAEAMMETLPATKQKALLTHENNPNPSKLDEKVSGISTAKGHKTIRAATATGSRSDKPSIRDHIKAQKKKISENPVALTTERPKEHSLEHADSLEQRPQSAGSIAAAPMPAKPVRPVARPLPARPKTATATTAPAMGTLSSAPKRPTVLKKANGITATKFSNPSTDLDVTKGADQGVGLNISTDENEAAISTAAVDQKRGRPLSVITNPPDSQSRIPFGVAPRIGQRSVSPDAKEPRVSGEAAELKLTSGFVRVLTEVVSDQSHELPEHTFGALVSALRATDVSTRREGVELGVSLHRRLGSGFFDKVPGLDSSEKDLLLYYIAKRK